MRTRRLLQSVHTYMSRSRKSGAKTTSKKKIGYTSAQLADVLVLVSPMNETLIDPISATALLKLSCSLSSQPMLEHRLTFSTEFVFGGARKSLHAEAPLKVGHGSFGSAEISVQPVRISH